MGFCFFPKLYKDELLYSLFSRYHAGSGNGVYSYTAKELFKNPYTRPAFKFMNQLTPEALEALTREADLEEVILDHTMFPEYARFAGQYKRKGALNSLKNMQGNLNSILSVGRSKAEGEYYLRYCPLCADNDRKIYGETYWHRIHQLRGIRICPEHHCLLLSSEVPLRCRNKPELTAAEHVVPSSVDGVAVITDARETSYTEYIKNVFNSPVDMDNPVETSNLLSIRINDMYLDNTKTHKRFSLFLDEYRSFYSFLDDNQLMDRIQLQRVLSGKRNNHHEICQLAMFTDISVSELTRPDSSIIEAKEEQIFQIVSEKLDIDQNTVREVGREVLKLYNKSVFLEPEPGDKRDLWDEMDRKLLPEVRRVITAFHGDGLIRPRRVTVNAVTKELGLPQKRIEKLPLCRNEIISGSESQQEYWARETAWAYHKVVSEGRDVCWTRIRELTNMRRVDFMSCQPFLDQYMKEEEIQFLYSIL